MMTLSSGESSKLSSSNKPSADKIGHIPTREEFQKTEWYGTDDPPQTLFTISTPLPSTLHPTTPQLSPLHLSTPQQSISTSMNAPQARVQTRSMTKSRFGDD